MNGNLLRTKYIQNAHGATLVETAIFLPLFLFGILFFVWLGVTWNEKSTLNAGLGNAVRIGATRGNSTTTHQNILVDVDNWSPISAPSSPSNTVQDLLAYNNLPNGTTDWSTARQFYDDPSPPAPLRSSHQIFTSITYLQEMPPQHKYTLIYIYQSLRQSIGNSIRYPCNPHDATNGAGCVSCRFLNPETQADNPNISDPPSGDVIAVSCDYRPANFILAPLYGLLGIISRVSGTNVPVFVLKASKRFVFQSGEIS
jgi:hypothetical protein